MSSSSSSSLGVCELCEELYQALHPDGGQRRRPVYKKARYQTVEISSWNELRFNKGCSTCSHITSLFDEQLHGWQGRSRCARTRYVVVFDFSQGEDVFLKLLSIKLEAPRAGVKIWIRPQCNDTFDRGAVRMDPNWIDLERALGWVRTCDTMHERCHVPLSLESPRLTKRDMYLVNLTDNCLVPVVKEVKYVALSYVWGQGVGRFTTSKSILELLMKPDSLSRRNIQDQLPGVVKRAMVFAFRLGVNYLWTDCLCIIQDDPTHVNSQINFMANIYSSSYLTICAADEDDAESSLRGIPGTSLPRSVQQETLSISDGFNTSHWIAPKTSSNTTWSRRGWTFQEQVLSRRTLIVRDNGLEWTCQEVSAEEQEAEIRSLEMSSHVDDKISWHDIWWPCLKKWSKLVNSYLRRQLRYEEDILRAFRGVEEALQTSFCGGFHFGLPEQFFDAGLLWIPMAPVLPRTFPQCDPYVSKLPSWSWAGWKGPLINKIYDFGADHIRSLKSGSPSRSNIYIQPSVTWCKLTINPEKKTQIRNDYYTYRSFEEKGDCSLPSGWSKSYDKDGFSFYLYDKAPAGCTFWYPLSTDIDTTQLIIHHNWTSVLYCKTQRGFLDLHEPFLYQSTETKNKALDNDYNVIFSLHDQNMEWAGIIYVHEPAKMDRNFSQRCELVLISQGCVRSQLPHSEMAHVGFFNLPEYFSLPSSEREKGYSFYHLLWIERRDAFAYRKGLARVRQSTWENIVKDEIELFLA